MVVIAGKGHVWKCCSSLVKLKKKNLVVKQRTQNDLLFIRKRAYNSPGNQIGFILRNDLTTTLSKLVVLDL